MNTNEYSHVDNPVLGAVTICQEEEKTNLGSTSPAVDNCNKTRTLPLLVHITPPSVTSLRSYNSIRSGCANTTPIFATKYPTETQLCVA